MQEEFDKLFETLYTFLNKKGILKGKREWKIIKRGNSYYLERL